MNPATPVGIANADAHLNDVGLPTYSELVGALRDLMNYTGGWDEKPSHPCGKAARVISRLEAAGKFLYRDPTAQDDTPTIDLMHVSYDRILDTYSKAYPGLPPELMANDIVGHVCELIERSATQALRDDGGDAGAAAGRRPAPVQGGRPRKVGRLQGSRHRRGLWQSAGADLRSDQGWCDQGSTHPVLA